MKGQSVPHLSIALGKAPGVEHSVCSMFMRLRSVVTLAQMFERTMFILANVILAGPHDLFSFALHSKAKVGR